MIMSNLHIVGPCHFIRNDYCKGLRKTTDTSTFFRLYEFHKSSIMWPVTFRVLVESPGLEWS
jgi:hypothetical protein